MHHLDKRAANLIAQDAGDEDDLLTTKQLTDWFGVSEQWAEIGRSSGYGPRFIKLSPRRVRYRRSDVIEWLEERTHACTSDYPEEPDKELGAEPRQRRIGFPGRGRLNTVARPDSSGTTGKARYTGTAPLVTEAEARRAERAPVLK